MGTYFGDWFDSLFRPGAEQTTITTTSQYPATWEVIYRQRPKRIKYWASRPGRMWK